MYLILRFIAIVILALFTMVFGIGYCLFSPRNPKHVYTFGQVFGKLAPLFGVKVILRGTVASKGIKQAVMIANHQSNWDLITVSKAIRPNTVTVGKKSLIYIPVFGLLYWITGNVLIDRDNRTKAVGTIGQIVKKMRERKISVWLFPEGTRSRGRGLLPFKTGAFHAAIDAEVPILPIICSSTRGFSVSRRNNGHVIVEMLNPVSTDGYDKTNVRALASHCHEMMATRMAELDAEVAELNKKA